VTCQLTPPEESSCLRASSRIPRELACVTYDTNERRCIKLVSYFISQASLTAFGDAYQRLADSGLGLPFSVSGEPGVVVSETSWTSVQEFLKITLGPVAGTVSSTTASLYSGIVMVQLGAAAQVLPGTNTAAAEPIPAPVPIPEPSFSYYGGHGTQAMTVVLTAVREKLYGAANINEAILVDIGSGTPNLGRYVAQRNRAPEGFFLFLHLGRAEHQSAPGNFLGAAWRGPTYFFAPHIAVPNHDNAAKCAGKVVHDPWTMTPIWQYTTDGRGVRCLVDVLYDGGSQSEMTVFRILLDELVLERTTSVEEQLARRQACHREMTLRSRADFVRVAMARVVRTRASTVNKIREMEVAVTRLQNKICEALRNAAGARRKIVQLDADIPTREEHYRLEFERLAALEKIQRVVIDGDFLVAFTDVLYCTNPDTGKVHELGRYKIRMCMDHVDVTFNNLDRRICDRHAPHVSSAGTPCLGNLAEMLPQLVGEENYEALITVCVQFLESVNTADTWGRDIVCWPLKAGQSDSE
jgi:hypothetical protein